MFILGTICCRAGSKGLKNKNTKLLCGKPLVSYTLETSMQCSILNEIIVSTDSQEIAGIAHRAGIALVIDRPAELAQDDSSKWPVFIHAVESFELARNAVVDYLVDMDATAPLKVKEDIEGAVRFALQHPEADVVITAYDAESNPYFNMMELNENNFAVLTKPWKNALVCRQDAPQVYSLSPAAFVIKKHALYKYSHWSEAKCMLYIIPRERAVDIDTEMDFKFVEFLMLQKLAGAKER